MIKKYKRALFFYVVLVNTCLLAVNSEKEWQEQFKAAVQESDATTISTMLNVSQDQKELVKGYCKQAFSEMPNHRMQYIPGMDQYFENQSEKTLWALAFGLDRLGMNFGELCQKYDLKAGKAWPQDDSRARITSYLDWPDTRDKLAVALAQYYDASASLLKKHIRDHVTAYSMVRLLDDSPPEIVDPFSCLVNASLRRCDKVHGWDCVSSNKSPGVTGNKRKRQELVDWEGALGSEAADAEPRQSTFANKEAFDQYYNAHEAVMLKNRFNPARGFKVGQK